MEATQSAQPVDVAAQLDSVAQKMGATKRTLAGRTKQMVSSGYNNVTAFFSHHAHNAKTKASEKFADFRAFVSNKAESGRAKLEAKFPKTYSRVLAPVGNGALWMGSKVAYVAKGFISFVGDKATTFSTFVQSKMAKSAEGANDADMNATGSSDGASDVNDTNGTDGTDGTQNGGSKEAEGKEAE